MGVAASVGFGEEVRVSDAVQSTATTICGAVPEAARSSPGVDDIPRFDAYLEVYAASHVVRVDYDTPYIRHLPARLSVTRTHGSAGIEQSSSFPLGQDTFVTEWLAFHDHLTRRATPKMGIEDARMDLELSLEIIERVRAG